MQELAKKKATAIALRARVPMVARVVGLSIMMVGVGFVAISYYRLRNNQPFRLRSEAPELSKEITGIIEGYEQRVTKDDRLHLLLRASRDITYSDGHHELENVRLAVYPPEGEKPDEITANRAVYNPQSSEISFLGSVKIQTKDNLTVSTEAITFNQNTEVAHTDAPISFNRENVSGEARGAVVASKGQKIDLKQDVRITVAPELIKDPQAKPTSRSRPVTIRSNQAVFEQQSLRLSFTGGVTAEQERDIMSGDNLYAVLNPQKRLQKVEVRGKSYLRTAEEGHAAELHSEDLDFFLDQDQRLERAVAMREVQAKSLDADADVSLTTPNLLEASFQAQDQRSLLREMRTEGRSVVDISAPKSKAGDPRAANKRLTADSVKLTWRVNGRDLEKAEAVGNAELFIDPVIKNAQSDQKTLLANRFDCDFFEVGNLARICTASGGAKGIMKPLHESEERGVRTITARKMVAFFLKETQDLEHVDAEGDAKFNEKDRNGLSSAISYTSADQTVRFRGGEPTVWDSRARTKALELESNLRDQISYSRGKTATTYYNQEQTNGATPFTKVKSPVYIVSDRAEFHHDSGVAIYSGNARAWQDDNFVRAEKLTIYVNEKRMIAEDRVQSALYSAKRKAGGAVSSVPTSAAANWMSYSENDHLLHYEGNVDIRQGTDRLTSDKTDVYLTAAGELEKTIAEKNVVLTQPNRKATGDWIQYTAADEIAILTGKPARVEDVEQGSTEGGRLTVYMREGRVIADNVSGPQAAGRVRSTHKVRRQ